jgi:hypothetical protein
MDSDEKLGRAAYEAYCAEVAGTSPMNGPWDGIADHHKRTWIAVGRAVAAEAGRSEGDRGGSC